MKLKTKILIVTLLLINAVFVTATGFTLKKSRELATVQAVEITKAVAREKAEIVSEILNNALYTGRIIANTFESMKQNEELDRMKAIEMLKYYVEQHPEYYGIWMGWEPNAFDGADEDYKNTEYHDETGRFIPYWLYKGNQVIFKTLTNYNEESTGDYYLIPLKSKKEAIIKPMRI